MLLTLFRATKRTRNIIVRSVVGNSPESDNHN